MSTIPAVIALTVAAITVEVVLWLSGATAEQAFGPAWIMGFLVGCVFGIIARDWRIVR